MLLDSKSYSTTSYFLVWKVWCFKSVTIKRNKAELIMAVGRLQITIWQKADCKLNYSRMHFCKLQLTSWILQNAAYKLGYCKTHLKQLCDKINIWHQVELNEAESKMAVRRLQNTNWQKADCKLEHYKMHFSMLWSNVLSQIPFHTYEPE